MRSHVLTPGPLLLVLLLLGAAPVAATEMHGWGTAGTAWRTSAGWVWPEPLLETVAAAVRAQAVAVDRAAWDVLEPVVAAHLAGLGAGAIPSPTTGTQVWQEGGVTVRCEHAWEADFWVAWPVGATGPAGLTVTLGVEGRVLRPRGALALEGLTTVPVQVSPLSWSGTGPVEVWISVTWPDGSSLLEASRADGGPVWPEETDGGVDFLVPLAAGVATSLRLRTRRPGMIWMAEGELQHALDWEVRGPDGSTWWRAPLRRGEARGSGRVSLWAAGLAGRWQEVAAVEVPTLEEVEEEAWVMLAAAGEGGAPVAAVRVDPAIGADPLATTVHWVTAGATTARLRGPVGAAEVPLAGQQAMSLRYQWAGARDLPWWASVRLEASGPGGEAAAEAGASVIPRPAQLEVEGPQGDVSVATQKAAGG